MVDSEKDRRDRDYQRDAGMLSEYASVSVC